MSKLNRQVTHGSNGVPVEYLGTIELPYSIGGIERIIAGSQISLSILDEKERESHHKREPLTNLTGAYGFLDFVQGAKNGCDLYKTAVYGSHRRNKIFEQMLKFLAEIGKNRGIVSIYAAVERDYEPMLNAMQKYGFRRVGNMERLINFKADISDLNI